MDSKCKQIAKVTIISKKVNKLFKAQFYKHRNINTVVLLRIETNMVNNIINTEKQAVPKLRCCSLLLFRGYSAFSLLLPDVR